MIVAHIAHTRAETWAGYRNHDAPDRAGKACLVEHRANFHLRGFRIAQRAGMPNVKIEDHIVIRGDFLEQWKQRLRRFVQPRRLRMRGEEMDLLPIFQILGGDTVLAVHAHGVKVQQVLSAIVPARENFQHQLAEGHVCGGEPVGE